MLKMITLYIKCFHFSLVFSHLFCKKCSRSSCFTTNQPPTRTILASSRCAQRFIRKSKARSSPVSQTTSDETRSPINDIQRTHETVGPWTWKINRQVHADTTRTMIATLSLHIATIHNIWKFVSWCVILVQAKHKETIGNKKIHLLRWSMKNNSKHHPMTQSCLTIGFLFHGWTNFGWLI